MADVAAWIDLHQHPTTDADSLWVVVNKDRALDPIEYVPDSDLVEGYRVHQRVVAPLTRLLAAARSEGLDVRILSAYRSHGRQGELHAERSASVGTEAAEQLIAPPGHSEHQTGLAVDLGRSRTGVCNMDVCFGDTAEGRWLSANAWRFGFIERYRAEGRAVTGYAPEPWHFRFVGRELAAHMHEAGIVTLEEVFVPPGS